MLTKGRYRARFAACPEDVAAAQALRHVCFHGRLGEDSDRFDAVCEHVLVEDAKTGRLACTFRLMPLPCGAEISRSYSAQYYELGALEGFDGRMVEMGRFCIHPEARDADVLRVAWAAMTRYVDDNAVEMLFGCSSFRGTDADTYLDTFDMLATRHLAPKRWLPRVKAADVVRLAGQLRRRPDPKTAMQRTPPLLRTYLAMGGWVSDHAVVDREMNTLHVFTGVEIRAVPKARARALRALAG